MSEPFGIGLLGHGTVGAAFAELLEARAGEIEAITGLRPELRGVLTRSRGDFDAIVGDCDLVVEVMGGLDPARDYVLRAMAAAHVDRLHGIVNGTTNFILTRMAETGASYDDALAEAQSLGYAEADPTEDVNGKDAAAKM